MPIILFDWLFRLCGDVFVHLSVRIPMRFSIFKFKFHFYGIGNKAA